ncbi:hypothetical protein TVAG_419030 [Trichomonas vaginalis G3]|uniref:Uncharacterized protein n=1 Tax=Trichomonas vaginalis (strain ATCC PRA-98 / G3) TaxID=412133 RepID=A2F5H4_TRIV3|nr:hypothetical protein TVAGG3_0158210 [Trichomonas vaginalis G3]EAX99846.1 hypothetical protein TVAG_419030 [Trichomonas vaginalis G3]KAI5547686.1 hypothetical protein TVAGG3_0158210 [Trichomonas vaginalis G3]|eukprot:XP_001312776.1 hypothetical protein [Trichomonas vaginalis G3]
MSDVNIAAIKQTPKQDVQTISYLIVFKLAWLIMVIAYPALKTYSVVIEQEDQRANGLRIKWGYYWITAPFLVMIFKLFDWILGDKITFHIINLIITFILTKNNDYYIRQLTIKLTAKFYKNYYKQIKEIPTFIGNLFKNGSVLIVSLIFGGKKQEPQESEKAPRRTKFE